jgi:hypothetical protein
LEGAGGSWQAPQVRVRSGDIKGHLKTFFLKQIGVVAFLGLCLATARGAQLPAEQLLPTETIAMFTVKDFPEATNNFFKGSLGRLWNDDAMRATREKFGARLTNDLYQPLERALKVKAEDYLDLLRGQVTVAATKALVETNTEGFVMLVDTKDKAELLTTRLADLRKKWTDSGRKLKAEKIRDLEFTTYEFPKSALTKFTRTVMGKDVSDNDEEEEKGKDAPEKMIDLLIGQSQSLLLVGTQARDLEKILARQNGAASPGLADVPAFQENYNALFREAGIYGWLDFKPVFQAMTKPDAGKVAAESSGIGNLRLEKIIPATGIGEIKSVALKVVMGADGYNGEILLSAPEAQRSGIVKILAPPAKDTTPPPFVPADALTFSRIRIDMQAAWSSVEGILMKIDPSVAGIVQLMLNAAGKDKDPDFDLKKSFIESIGDDIINYSKAGKNGEPITLSLIGARNPEALINGVKVISRMLPEPLGNLPWKEREFLGRKIQTLGGDDGASGTSLVASGGYVAVSGDSAILEEYLRSGENPPKPLRDTPGFVDAAQKAGGLNTGWFGYENEVETMRAAFAAAKADPNREKSSGNSIELKFSSEAQARSLPEWIDAASLPPFDRVAKYFYHSLYTVGSTPQGISIKLALPAPPGLK